VKNFLEKPSKKLCHPIIDSANKRRETAMLANNTQEISCPHFFGGQGQHLCQLYGQLCREEYADGRYRRAKGYIVDLMRQLA